MSHARFYKVLVVGAVLVYVAASFAPSGRRASRREIRRARDAQKKKTQEVSRLGLQNDQLRFAQIFILGLQAKMSFRVERQQDNAMRFALGGGELCLVDNMLTTATGPEPVVNLLDMVIYVTLARLYVYNNWDAKRYGKGRGELSAFFGAGRRDGQTGPEPAGHRGEAVSAGAGLEYRLSQLEKGVDAAMRRAFLWAALLIVFFFAVMFVSRREKAAAVRWSLQGRKR